MGCLHLICKVVSASELSGDLAALHQDGFEDAYVQDLGGRCPANRNAARDIDRKLAKLCSTCCLPRPYVVPLIAKVNGKLEVRDVPVTLPHEVIHWMHGHHPEELSQRLSGTEEQRREFWKHMDEFSPWLATQPGFDPEHPENMVPLKCHGDGVVFNKAKQKLMVMNFSSNLFHGSCTETSRILMFAVRCNLFLSWDPLLAVLAWSFGLLLGGVMPTVNHDGEPLDPARQALGGQPIAGKFRFLMTCCCGDWEFLRDVFQLEEHYNTDEVCFICKAVKSATLFTAWNYRLDAPWCQTIRDPVEWLLDKAAVAMCKIPGISLLTIEMDLMHTLALGILAWLCGAVLFELVHVDRRWAAADPLQGGWEHRFAKQLRVAFHEFDAWMKSQRCTHSHPCFTVRSLGMTALRSPPEMKGKAANMLHVARWMRVICQEYVGFQHADVRANCLWGFLGCVDILKAAPTLLTETHAIELETCRSAALLSYGWLSGQCGTLYTPLYLTKPKHHLFDHLCRRACVRRHNPMRWWCFMDEDFVGSVAAMARTLHGGRSLESKFASKWLARLYLSMTA